MVGLPFRDAADLDGASELVHGESNVSKPDRDRESEINREKGSPPCASSTDTLGGSGVIAL